jgi:hypothetical protein
MEQEDTWKWIDGSTVDIRYGNWFEYGPNDEGGQDCVAIRWEDGLWSDEACNMKLPYVCKVSIGNEWLQKDHSLIFKSGHSDVQAMCHNVLGIEVKFTSTAIKGWKLVLTDGYTWQIPSNYSQMPGPSKAHVLSPGQYVAMVRYWLANQRSSDYARGLEFTIKGGPESVTVKFFPGDGNTEPSGSPYIFETDSTLMSDGSSDSLTLPVYDGRNFDNMYTNRACCGEYAKGDANRRCLRTTTHCESGEYLIGNSNCHKCDPGLTCKSGDADLANSTGDWRVSTIDGSAGKLRLMACPLGAQRKDAESYGSQQCTTCPSGTYQVCVDYFVLQLESWLVACIKQIRRCITPWRSYMRHTRSQRLHVNISHLCLCIHKNAANAQRFQYLNPCCVLADGPKHCRQPFETRGTVQNVPFISRLQQRGAGRQQG